MLLTLAALAWAGSCVAALVMLPEARDALRAASRRDRRGWWAALAVAALVRALVPFDLVRVFTGWDLLGSAFVGAPLPRYGAGFVALLRPWLALRPDPEWWVAGLNLSLGVATVAGLSLAVWRWRPRATLLPASAWALALLPVWVRHHRSESALVAGFAVWLLGLAAYARWLRSGRRSFAWLAVAPLLAAAYTRPTFALTGPVAIAALHRWLPGAVRARRSRAAWVTLLWLLVPQLLWLALGGQTRAARGDLPATRSLWFVAQLPVMLVGMNLALWPHAFPLALSVAGLRGVWRAWRGRASDADWPLVAATGVVGAALLAAGMADPVVVSLPRLQAPWLGLWAVVCVALLLPHQRAVGQDAGPSRRHATLLVVALVTTAALTVPWLFRPENADHEDAALREAVAHLRGRRGTLHRLTPGDAGSDKVSRHFPAWRVRAPNARLRVAPLRAVPEHTSAASPRWVWLGVRCYARHRGRGEPAPARFEQPACARVRPRLVPVFERRVVNHGDVHFPWWPRAPELKVGLYRVPTAGARPPPATPAAGAGDPSGATPPAHPR